MLAVVNSMRRFQSLIASLGTVLVYGCAQPNSAPPTVEVDPASLLPSPTELKRDLMVFASDSFRGRETGTADERRAAAFLIRRVASLGLKPMGDSEYVQRVPLERTTVGETHFAARAAGGGGSHQLWGLEPLVDVGPGISTPAVSAEGPLVFVGYGVPRPGGADDLARIPVEGRVVVVINGAPIGADASVRAELESPAAVGARLQRIIPLHPAAVIVLLTGSSMDLYTSLGRALSHGTLALAGDSAMAVVPASSASGTPAVQADLHRATPMILLGIANRGSPLVPARWPRDDRPQLLPAGRFSGSVALNRAPVEGYNVVAGIPGRDSTLRRTWIAMSAHLDHLGILPVSGGDSVAHGADDDGSGSVALLAVAKAMTQAPTPLRSTLFIWHTGEAKGLLGSAFFAAHPTVPLDSIMALINVDMVGRNSPESLFVVGPGAAPHAQSQQLGRLIDSVNATLPRPFVFNRAWDTPASPERLYFRGDSYNYAERGVPIAFLTSGSHADHQRVTDDASRVDYQKLAHVTQLLIALGEAAANLEARSR
jgi:hypothetical protein